MKKGLKKSFNNILNQEVSNKFLFLILLFILGGICLVCAVTTITDTIINSPELNISGNLSVGADIYVEKISPPTSSLVDTLLLGQGALTVVFNDTGATIASQKTTTSTLINFTQSYSDGQIQKSDILIITNASDSENNGAHYIVGRYPPDNSDTQVEVNGHLTVGGTADITVYSKSIAIDRDGRILAIARAGAIGGHDDTDVMYEFGYEHNLSGESPGQVIGILIMDYNQGTTLTTDYPIYIYKYDGLGHIFSVNGQGDIYGDRNLTIGGDIDLSGDVWSAKSTNAPVTFAAYNSNAGSSAKAQLAVGQISTGGNYGLLEHFGTGFTAAGERKADRTTLTGIDTEGLGLGAKVGPIVFFTGSGYTEKARFDQDGKLGIGTDNPITALDVVGNITVNISSGQSGITMYDDNHDVRCMKCWSDGVCNSTSGQC